MSNGQTYNQYTECVQPGGYGGLYLGGGVFLAGLIATIALLVVDPGAAPLAAILTGIGYCRWWLYARLVCLGQPNACTVGLVVRIDTKQDQAGIGKFDTDYTLYLLLPPNPLMGDPDWYNKMNEPAVSWPDALMQDQASPGAPVNAAYEQMRATYTASQQPYGFSGEIITGYDLQNHDGYQTLPPAQTQALNFTTPPGWQPGYFYNAGDQVRDSNGGVETAVDQGLSGSDTPAWPNPDLRNWQPTVGEQTNDYGTIWRYESPVPSAGILEVEFEGAGMWNLYQVLLAFSPVAAVLAAGCSAVPVLGWLACLIAALILAVIVLGIGALAGLTDNSAESDVSNQVGALTPGVDILLVSGTWVWDGGHIPNGWNELHPVLFAEKIAAVPHADLIAGTPWASFPQFSTAELENTLSQLCGLVGTAQDPVTQTQQQLPQNSWVLHPLVDGCVAPAEPPPPIQ